MRDVPNRSGAGLFSPVHRFAPFTVDDQIAYAARMAGEVGGNAIRNTFTDSEALDGLLADFDRATRKIQFETFLFSGDHGEAIADKLIEKRRDGLQVQVLLDGKGATFDGHKLANKLKAAGVDVLYYDTSVLNKSLIAVDHAKLAVIDDGVAWIGGANFDKEISRDMMTRIAGPGAAAVQRVFNQGWRDSGGRAMPSLCPIAPQGDVTVAVSQTGPREASARGMILRELRDLGRGDELKLWMMDLGDHQLLEELLAAHRRGAKITALLDPEVPFQTGGFSDRIKRAIIAGAPDLYAISRMQDQGIDVRYYKKPPDVTKLHGKVWLFVKGAGTPGESMRVIGGSVNGILGALDINREAAVLLHGKQVGRDVRSAIDDDLARNSVAIPPVGRTFGEKVRIWLVRLATKYLV